MSEITEDSVKPEEEFNLVVEGFGLREKFEINSVQGNIQMGEKIMRNVNERKDETN